MGNITKEEKDLELIARELEKENRELKARDEELEARNRELEGTVLEYEYRLGIISRPDHGITLKDYLDGLNERKPGYDGKRHVIKEARVLAPVSKRSWFLGFHYLQFTIDGERANASFICWCPKEHKLLIEDILNSVANTNYKVILIAHGKNYFIDGIIKENNERIYFGGL